MIDPLATTDPHLMALISAIRDAGLKVGPISEHEVGDWRACIQSRSREFMLISGTGPTIAAALQDAWRKTPVDPAPAATAPTPDAGDLFA